jgi:hypothetical protein
MEAEVTASRPNRFTRKKRNHRLYWTREEMVNRIGNEEENQYFCRESTSDPPTYKYVYKLIIL